MDYLSMISIFGAAFAVAFGALGPALAEGRAVVAAMDAIARQSEAANSLLNDAKTALEKAEAALSDVTATRDGMAAEREVLLGEAATKSEATAKAAQASPRCTD